MRALTESLKEYIVVGIEESELNIEDSDCNKIKNYLNSNYTGSFRISAKPNRKGLYTVSSNNHVSCKNTGITSLTNGLFEFLSIKGCFSCNHCTALTSLEGAPKNVYGNFMCIDCTSLESLEGAPDYVGGSFTCSKCESIKTLKGAPRLVFGSFFCSKCTSLQSLEGVPERVPDAFDCTGCTSLKSLKGIEWVGGYLNCRGCDKIVDISGVQQHVGGEIYR